MVKGKEQETRDKGELCKGKIKGCAYVRKMVKEESEVWG